MLQQTAEQVESGAQAWRGRRLPLLLAGQSALWREARKPVQERAAQAALREAEGSGRGPTQETLLDRWRQVS